MTAKIATALHEVMSKVGYIQKTGKNSFHGYKYAGEADLLDKLRPAMVEAGLMLLPSVKSVSPVDEHGNVLVQMEYTLIHKDGDVWPISIGAAGMGNDRAKNGSVGDKGVYKAITGANKYVLFKLFQIETGDDPESASDHDHTSDARPERQLTPNTVTGPAIKPLSAAQLKKHDEWPQFMNDLFQCETVGQINGLYKVIKNGGRWNDMWLKLAADECAKYKADLLKKQEAELEADTFPGDLPANSNFVSTLQAGE